MQPLSEGRRLDERGLVVAFDGTAALTAVALSQIDQGHHHPRPQHALEPSDARRSDSALTFGLSSKDPNEEEGSADGDSSYGDVSTCGGEVSGNLQARTPFDEDDDGDILDRCGGNVGAFRTSSSSSMQMVSPPVRAEVAAANAQHPHAPLWHQGGGNVAAARHSKIFFPNEAVELSADVADVENSTWSVGSSRPHGGGNAPAPLEEYDEESHTTSTSTSTSRSSHHLSLWTGAAGVGRTEADPSTWGAPGAAASSAAVSSSALLRENWKPVSTIPPGSMTVAVGTGPPSVSVGHHDTSHRFAPQQPSIATTSNNNNNASAVAAPQPPPFAPPHQPPPPPSYATAPHHPGGLHVVPGVGWDAPPFGTTRLIGGGLHIPLSPPGHQPSQSQPYHHQQHQMPAPAAPKHSAATITSNNDVQPLSAAVAPFAPQTTHEGHRRGGKECFFAGQISRNLAFSVLPGLLETTLRLGIIKCIAAKEQELHRTTMPAGASAAALNAPAQIHACMVRLVMLEVDRQDPIDVDKRIVTYLRPIAHMGGQAKGRVAQQIQQQQQPPSMVVPAVFNPATGETRDPSRMAPQGVQSYAVAVSLSYLPRYVQEVRQGLGLEQLSTTAPTAFAPPGGSNNAYYDPYQRGGGPPNSMSVRQHSYPGAFHQQQQPPYPGYPGHSPTTMAPPVAVALSPLDAEAEYVLQNVHDIAHLSVIVDDSNEIAYFCTDDQFVNKTTAITLRHAIKSAVEQRRDNGGRDRNPHLSVLSLEALGSARHPPKPRQSLPPLYVAGLRGEMCSRDNDPVSLAVLGVREYVEKAMKQIELKEFLEDRPFGVPTRPSAASYLPTPPPAGVPAGAAGGEPPREATVYGQGGHLRAVAPAYQAAPSGASLVVPPGRGFPPSPPPMASVLTTGGVQHVASHPSQYPNHHLSRPSSSLGAGGNAPVSHGSAAAVPQLPLPSSTLADIIASGADGVVGATAALGIQPSGPRAKVAYLPQEAPLLPPDGIVHLLATNPFLAVLARP